VDWTGGGDREKGEEQKGMDYRRDGWEEIAALECIQLIKRKVGKAERKSTEFDGQVNQGRREA